MLVTLIITFSLFFFVLFLVYIVYCYAYYNEDQEESYIELFNNNKYQEVYNNLDNDSDLEYNDFLDIINFVSDKNELRDIYYTYYADNMSLEDFMNIYYYGKVKIDSSDVLFLEVGKTDLFHRRKIKYKEIKIENKNGYRTSLGLKKNVILEIEYNSRISLDGNNLECIDNICHIDNIFGGLHTIKYTSNNIDYFGIINILKDDQVINIPLESSLIKISGNNVVTGNIVENATLEYGKYSLNKCYLSSGCPSKKSSYMLLNQDKTVEYYTYITLEQAGDYYYGTYEIQGDFLVLSFKSHIYKVFDYDTKQTTDIEAEVDMEFRYKIEDNYTVSNDNYKFKYSM